MHTVSFQKSLLVQAESKFQASCSKLHICDFFMCFEFMMSSVTYPAPISSNFHLAYKLGSLKTSRVVTLLWWALVCQGSVL